MNALPAEHTAHWSPSPEHADELHRLGRMLEGSSGGFALIIAGYNRPLYRDQLIKTLASADGLEGSAVLDVGHFNDLCEFETQLEREEGQASGPLHLIGLDNWLAHDKDRPQGLERMRGFNRHRDYIAKLCRRPLVLWLLEHQIGEFAREAPDAWEWRAGVVNFAIHGHAEEIELPELPHSFIDNWEERQARIVELREFLSIHRTQSNEHRRVSMVWDELGELLAINGDWSESLAAYEQVCGYYEQEGDLQNCAKALAKIALANLRCGHSELALNQARTCLGIFKDHSDWQMQAKTLALIADILQGQGKLEEALHIRYFEELPIYQRLGDIRLLSPTMGEIADLLLRMGDFQAARMTLEHILKIGGLDPLAIVLNTNRLADVLQAQGDLVKARATLEHALAHSEQAFGLTHPAVIATATHLGDVLLNMGDITGAQTTLERVLITIEKIFGTNHPRVAISANTLGNVAKLLGDTAKARSHYEQALSIFEHTFGPEHPLVTTLQKKLRELDDHSGKSAGSNHGNLP